MLDEYLMRLEQHLIDIKAALEKIADSPEYKHKPLPDVPISSQSTNDPKIIDQPIKIQVEATDNPGAIYGDEFAELKRMLESPEWPIAVDPDLICNESNAEDRQIRAEGIVDFTIDEPMTGKTFLDFGCGDGLCVPEASKKGAKYAVGYDLQRHDSWDLPFHLQDMMHTTDWVAVMRGGPYDVILIWDVLDHSLTDPIEALKQVRSVCHRNTKVYVRTHPWCSRTANHTYRTTNKAFTHLVFSDVEQVRLGLGDQIPVTSMVIHPQLTYTHWFETAGFKIIDQHPVTEEVGDFFHKNILVANRIKKNWKTSHEPQLASGEGFPHFQLRIQFIDYKISLH